MKKRGFEICKGYENQEIHLPIRKTKNSVGYDLESAEDICIPSIWKTVFTNIGKFFKGEKEFEPIKPTLVKTGIKSYFEEDEVLILANRSSNPGKKGLVLANSIGIVECDYYGNTDNDGNLMYAFYNFFPTDTVIHKHDTIGQAYFQKFLIADDDKPSDAIRTGGFGSTNPKE